MRRHWIEVIVLVPVETTDVSPLKAVLTAEQTLKATLRASETGQTMRVGAGRWSRQEPV